MAGVPANARNIGVDNTLDVSDAIEEAFRNYGGDDMILGREEGAFFAEYPSSEKNEVYRRNLLVVAGPKYKVVDI